MCAGEPQHGRDNSERNQGPTTRHCAFRRRIDTTSSPPISVLATSKTSTMQKELSEAGDQGFEFVGLTVGKTLMGGDEVVSILRRKAQ